MSDTNEEAFKEMEARLEDKLILAHNENENTKSEDTTNKSIPAVICIL